MDQNLKYSFTLNDYEALAGPDWPSYQSILSGELGPNLEIQEEIKKFLQMFAQDGIKFPIKTATACQSKWTWSTVWMNKLSTSSCHRVDPVRFDLENFDNFHNTPNKLAERQLMLEGKWPQGGCQYCQKIEEAGGFSDRQHNLEIRGLTPPELLENPTALSVTPKIVEIFAHNTCNFACIYCNGNLSSKIEQEGIKFGKFEKNGVTIPVVSVPDTSEVVFDKFIDWLDRNIQNLVRLHLLGGETFIQHNLMNSVLDVIKRRPNPQLELCIFSNLNSPEKHWRAYLDRIHDLQISGNMRVFDLTASIDCWGEQASYVRTGLDLDLFEQRLAWASEQNDWLRINLNQTVTSMTIKTMPDLIQIMNKYNKHKHIGHYFQFVTGHDGIQHPEVFAYDFWQQDFKKILDLMPKTTNQQREALPRMVGLQRQLQQVKHTDFNKVQQLHTYLDELDRRRSTDWRKLFPYLDIATEI